MNETILPSQPVVKGAQNQHFLSGYQPRSINEQAQTLVKMFPECSFYSNFPTRLPPDGAEGLFLRPNWRNVATTYEEALREVFRLLAKYRGNIENHLDNVSSRIFYYQTNETRKALEKLSIGGKGCVFPAQLGGQYQGYAFKDAHEAIVGAGQFGLDAFTVGIILLTHPELLRRKEHPRIFCAGEWHAIEGFPKVRFVPVFYYRDGALSFGSLEEHHISTSGFASGFLKF